MVEDNSEKPAIGNESHQSEDNTVATSPFGSLKGVPLPDGSHSKHLVYLEPSNRRLTTEEFNKLIRERQRDASFIGRIRRVFRRK